MLSAVSYQPSALSLEAPQEMVLIPAGEFLMGSPDDGASFDDERPQRRVYVSSVLIDRHEVTNARYKQFVGATGHPAPSHQKLEFRLWFHGVPFPGSEQHPVVNVSWEDAVAYCRWRGKRLPTEAEWEKAARGTDGRVYPWGNDPPTSVHAVYGLKEGGEETTSDIGDRDKGQSPYGAYDLAGNLYEWVMDWYAEDYYLNFAGSPAMNPRGPVEGTAKVQRGGSYLNSPYRLRSSFRTKGDPTEQDSNVGFRCAQDVPKLH